MKHSQGSLKFWGGTIKCGYDEALLDLCGVNFPDTTKMLNRSDDSWLSPFAYQNFQLYEYDLNQAKPHWGLTSYNKYFHQPVKKEARPITTRMTWPSLCSRTTATCSPSPRTCNTATNFGSRMSRSHWTTCWMGAHTSIVSLVGTCSSRTSAGQTSIVQVHWSFTGTWTNECYICICKF